MQRKDHLNLKKELVKKYYKLFPIHCLINEIVRELDSIGFEYKKKREQLTTSLNNIYFKMKGVKR